MNLGLRTSALPLEPGGGTSSHSTGLGNLMNTAHRVVVATAMTAAALLAASTTAHAANYWLDSTDFVAVGWYETPSDEFGVRDTTRSDGKHAYAELHGVPAGGSLYQTWTVYSGSYGTNVTKTVHLKAGKAATLKVCTKTSRDASATNCAYKTFTPS
jgi:hypothetical protein